MSESGEIEQIVKERVEAIQKIGYDRICPSKFNELDEYIRSNDTPFTDAEDLMNFADDYENTRQ